MVSLGVVLAILAGSVILSIALPKKEAEPASEISGVGNEAVNEAGSRAT